MISGNVLTPGWVIIGEFRAYGLTPHLSQGIVQTWLKQAGEDLDADEPLAVVANESQSIDLSFPYKGTIANIVTQQGGHVTGSRTVLARVLVSIHEILRSWPPSLEVDTSVLEYAISNGFDLRTIKGSPFNKKATLRDVMERVRATGVKPPPSTHAEILVGGDVVGQIAIGNNILQIGTFHGDRVIAAPPPSPSAEPVQRPAQVFLCHSSGDKDQVRELYRRLTADGVTCWFDEEDLLPGQNWDHEIRKAMKQSRFVLALLSEASITQAGYLQKELRNALDLAAQQPDGSVYLIPVRLELCELPDPLAAIQAADLFKRSGYDRLLKTLQYYK